MKEIFIDFFFPLDGPREMRWKKKNESLIFLFSVCSMFVLFENVK